MKKTKLFSFILAITAGLTIIVATSSTPTVRAAIGTSASYIMDSADVVNDGSNGTSPSYGMTGITGDNFDGQGSSNSYSACAGLVEETFSDCIAPPPPPPPGGGGGAGGRPYPVDGPPEEPETPDQPEEPEEPEEPIIPPPDQPSLPGVPQPAPSPEPQPEEPGPIAYTPTIIPFPPITGRGLLWRDNEWCADYFCFYPELELHGAATESAAAPLWPLILLLILILLLAKETLFKEEKHKKRR